MCLETLCRRIRYHIIAFGDASLHRVSASTKSSISGWTRPKNGQGGFLMPVALFIVVGLGALALAIARMAGNSQSSAVHQAITVQALYAAESGAQYGANQLLFNAVDKDEVDARCGLVEGATVNFNATGLSQCRAELSCVKTSTGAAAQVYELASRGLCGSGMLVAERTVVATVSYD